MNDSQKALAFKEEGNAEYKKGNLELAIEKYLQASELSPLDPVFQSNISAAYFELGRYLPCINSIELSLSVAQSNLPLQSKLLLRKAKCLLSLKRFEESKETIKQLIKLCEDNGLPIIEECKMTEKIIGESLLHKDYLLDSAAANSFLLTLPKYRPSSDTTAMEFFVIGHDPACSLLSGTFNKRDSLMLGSEKRVIIDHLLSPLSIFLGGVGDGRNLYSTLSDIADQMKTMHDFSHLNIHFTMIDIKASVLARNLVIGCLFEKLSMIEDKESEVAIQFMAQMQLILLAEVIPSYAYDLLQQTILDVEKCINNNTLPSYIAIQPSAIPEILGVLEYWKEVNKEFSSLDFIRNLREKESEVKRVMNEVKNNQEILGNMGEVGATFFNPLQDKLEEIPDSEIESLPGPGKIEEKRKLLKEMMKDDSLKNMAIHANNMEIGKESFIYDKFKLMLPPIPLMDRHPLLASLSEHPGTARENVKERTKHLKKDFQPNPTFLDEDWVDYVGLSLTTQSPYTSYSGYIGDVLVIEPGEQTIFDIMKEYFIKVANALATTKKYIKLEWMLGELCDIAQRLPIDQERLKMNFPTTYDRILLSNIPDYTGGTLFVSLYIMPLLKPEAFHSSVKFTVLLNTGRFKDYTEYSKTYTLLPTLESHMNFLGVKHQTGSLWEQDPRWCPLKSPLPTSLLVPHDTLMNWVMQMFFFIVLPIERSPNGSFRIELPLNLLSFMELIKRLVMLGYPAHWFSSLIANLLSGKVVTSVRPPPIYKTMMTTVSVKPFLPDLEVALSVYQPILPFSIAPPALPLLSNIKKYTINFSPLMPFGPPKSTVMGLFLTPISKPSPALLRSLRENIVNNNDSNCYLISILDWNSTILQATFWFNSTLMSDLIKNEWHITLVRTDTWTSDRPVSLKKVKEQQD